MICKFDASGKNNLYKHAYDWDHAARSLGKGKSCHLKIDNFLIRVVNICQFSITSVESIIPCSADNSIRLDW